ncbi:MAG TPA: hypothetical protein VHM64_05090, partial [Candidatus Binatia bacterium]|nr:hypothetical protein [Candidatus Binatia bacterium]
MFCGTMSYASRRQRRIRSAKTLFVRSPVESHRSLWSRRDFLGAAMTLPATLLLENATHTVARTQTVAATPACDDKDEPTPRQTAGPFFKPRSPQRTSLLEPGTKGTKILLQGHVRSTGCQPIAGALLDLWHADAAGAYDNAGYKFRGHQFADHSGRYAFE